MTSKLLSVLVVSAATFLAADASAHIDLKTPLSRTDNDDAAQKTGPCEGAPAGDRTELTAGETFSVTWDETIQHPGHFRIAINQDGDDFPTTDVLADFDDISGNGIILVETEGDTANTGYSHDITVPDVNCDNCTLQLIQVMTTAGTIDLGEDLYYRCADISITGASGDGGAGGSGSGNGGSSSSGEGGSSSGSNSGSGSGGGSAGGAGSGSGAGASPAAPTGDSGETHDCAVRAVGAASPASSLAMALGLGAMVSMAAARRRRRG